MPTPEPSPAAASLLEKTITSLRRRSKFAIFSGTFLRWAGIAAGISGSLVLLLRAGFREEPWPTPAYLVPLLFGLGAAFYWAGRRGMSRQGAAAWIDVHAGGSGLIVTGSEIQDERWQTEFEGALANAHRMPGLEVRRPASAALCGFGFLSLALFIRIPEPEPLGPSPEFVTSLAENVAAKLLALTENINLDEELAEELEERMERIKELAEEAPTESIFEAIDRLEERLGREGERVSKDLEQTLSDLWKSMEDGSLDQESMEQMLERAKGMLAAAGLGDKLPEDLAKMLGSSLELPAGMELSPAELMELAEGLSGLMEGSLGEMLGAGLMSASKLAIASKFAKLENFLPNDHECDEECREGG
jgi:hypothetical protein